MNKYYREYYGWKPKENGILDSQLAGKKPKTDQPEGETFNRKGRKRKVKKTDGVREQLSFFAEGEGLKEETWSDEEKSK